MNVRRKVIRVDIQRYNQYLSVCILILLSVFNTQQLKLRCRYDLHALTMSLSHSICFESLGQFIQTPTVIREESYDKEMIETALKTGLDLYWRTVSVYISNRSWYTYTLMV